MLSEDIVRYCAPTMACIKTGSMFNCLYQSRQEMIGKLRILNRMLRTRGMRIVPLRWKDGRVLIYLYRPEMLAEDLLAPAALQLLCECGYSCGNPDSCTERTSGRSADCGRYMTMWSRPQSSLCAAGAAHRNTCGDLKADVRSAAWRSPGNSTGTTLS